MTFRGSILKSLAVAGAACSVIALPAAALAAPARAGTDAVGRCRTADMSIQLDIGSSGGAPSYSLDFTNTGTKACLMAGEPKVLPVASDGTQVGKRSKSQDVTGKTKFVIGPGGTAQASLSILDANAVARCRQVTGAFLEVIPPSQRTGQMIPVFTFTACANKAVVEVDPVGQGS